MAKKADSVALGRRSAKAAQKKLEIKKRSKVGENGPHSVVTRKARATESGMMKVFTRSQTVIHAVARALGRLPDSARKEVQSFVSMVRTSGYRECGFEIDWASAVLAPLFLNSSAAGRMEYAPQIIITLPIFRRFSKAAQVGILAHEFAHASRAS